MNNNKQNMILDYFYLYVINPLFLFIDYFYEYKKNNKTKNEEMKELYEYDINEDKIKIIYFTNNGKKYIFKFDRKLNMNIKEILENLKESETKEVIIGASYNNNKDIINQVSEYLGPNGKHNMYQPLLVRDILTEEEISNFESLTIIDEMCEIKEITGLNDYIL